MQRNTVSSQARNASHALRSRIASHLCAPEKNLSSGPHMSHLVLLSHLPRTTSTSSSSFTLPSTTTHYYRDNSKNTQYIINLSKTSHSTSGAIKNHSGVKTCRVAELRAKRSPQFMSPKSLRLSQGSKLMLEIHISNMMHRKKLESEITEFRLPKK